MTFTTTIGDLTLDPRTAVSAGVNPEGLQRVAAACKAWISKLIDPGRRNNLLFRHLTQGTLDLRSAPDGTIALLLAGSARWS